MGIDLHQQHFEFGQHVGITKKQYPFTNIMSTYCMATTVALEITHGDDTQEKATPCADTPEGGL